MKRKKEEEKMKNTYVNRMLFIQEIEYTDCKFKNKEQCLFFLYDYARMLCYKNYSQYDYADFRNWKKMQVQKNYDQFK